MDSAPPRTEGMRAHLQRKGPRRRARRDRAASGGAFARSWLRLGDLLRPANSAMYEAEREGAGRDGQCTLTRSRWCCCNARLADAKAQSLAVSRPRPGGRSCYACAARETACAPRAPVPAARARGTREGLVRVGGFLAPRRAPTSVIAVHEARPPSALCLRRSCGARTMGHWQRSGRRWW